MLHLSALNASLRSWNGSHPLRFGVALCLTGSALAVRAALDQYLGSQFPYLTFFVAVVAAAYLAGFAPSLLATAAGYLAARWFVIEPRFMLRSPAPGTRLNAVAYFVGSVAVAGMCALASRARFRTGVARIEVARRQRQLEAEIVERQTVEQALRDADRRKDEFLAALSHELRNPLAPIRTAVHLLDRIPNDSPQAARARQVIGRQTEHLSRLIDDLLDITRISHGKIQLRCAVLDLREMVRQTCEDHRVLCEQGGLELRLDIPGGTVWADVDKTRITQVVGNLLQNAIKFTPAPGIVTVELDARDRRAEIRVRDTGIGMDPGRVEHMFAPFAQEERSLARTRGGLGLGLALAKALIQQHGGAIRAYSAGVGHGSEFVLILPLAEVSEEVPAPEAPARTAEHRRILVIEDNLDAGETLAEMLEFEGHCVHLARDGTTGIAMARELKPDVVLCDIGLPDVDGYEVARTLRADGSLRSIRLIAVSGYAQPEDKVRAKEAGFDAHLAKPSPIMDLMSLLA